jgi:hypothetical protein
MTSPYRYRVVAPQARRVAAYVNTKKTLLFDSTYPKLMAQLVGLLERARVNSARTVNAVMTATYWGIGRRIPALFWFAQTTALSHFWRPRHRRSSTSAANANVIGSIKEEQSRKMTTSTISRGNNAPLESILAGGVGDLLVLVGISVGVTLCLMSVLG